MNKEQLLESILEFNDVLQEGRYGTPIGTRGMGRGLRRLKTRMAKARTRTTVRNVVGGENKRMELQQAVGRRPVKTKKTWFENPDKTFYNRNRKIGADKVEDKGSVIGGMGQKGRKPF